jgi:hypothetical protein
MPLQEGKTARGQMEKIRLYHTILRAPDLFASATNGGERPVIFGLWKVCLRRVDKLLCRKASLQPYPSHRVPQRPTPHQVGPLVPWVSRIPRP